MPFIQNKKRLNSAQWWDLLLSLLLLLLKADGALIVTICKCEEPRSKPTHTRGAAGGGGGVGGRGSN